MIYTAENLPKTFEFNVDICIIGSGAGGSVVAAKMCSQGYNVLILEEGLYLKNDDFKHKDNEAIPRLYRNSAGFATDDMSLRILQGKVWGGSTTINWMTSLRTPEFVLNEWIDDFGLEEYSMMSMENHFQEIEKRLNVNKREIHSPANQILKDGCINLGIHYDTIPNNQIDCIACGKCGLGCYYDAKQDMRLTYLKDGLEKGLTAFTETKAEKISYTNKDKQVIHARISQQRVGKSDISLKINTKRTVVSASSIFTPLILQKSGLSKGGNVGKYLHVHPTVGTIGIFDDSKSPMYGTPQTIVSKESFKTNTYGYWQEIPDLEPFLLGVNAPFFGEKRREFMKNSDRTVTIITLIRDGKNKKSNGEISWRRGFNSQNGIISLKPLPSIRYKLSMEDRNTLIEGQINAAKILLSTDAKEVITLHNDPIIVNTPNDLDKIKMGNYNPNFVSMFSAHPLSTARMGKNKQLSVINETMEMHHFPGVFVMDGSSIPTALGVNPMITILSCVSKAIELGNINL